MLTVALSQALQRFLVAFRRSLCDRGEADTGKLGAQSQQTLAQMCFVVSSTAAAVCGAGPDDPLHLEVDGKFAKPTIKVLKVGFQSSL